MTATQTTTRVFGKCFRKGCRYTHVTGMQQDERGRVLFPSPQPSGAVFYEHAVAGYWPQVDAAMTAASLTCPQHGATMRYEGLKATYNPEKICDGRCMSAKRASCECSCGGKNHGAHSAL